MFRFGSSFALWGLAGMPVLLGLFWLSARRRRRLLEVFAEHPLLDRLGAHDADVPRRWKGALLILAFGLLTVGLARPQFGDRVETVRREGQDIIIALDVSRSMLAEDIRPNRLDRAKLELGRIIQRLDGDRVGIVAFAGDAFIQSPLTTDYGAAMMFLGSMDTELIRLQGTDLGLAITTAVEAFAETPPENRILVIVTDGEDHEGGLPEAMALAGEAGVTIHTVGVGSVEGIPLPEVDANGIRRGFRRDGEGNVITTRLEETALQDVALQTGGGYYRVGAGGDGLASLVESLSDGGRELESRELTQYEERFQGFVFLALLLLIAEFLIPLRGWGKRSRSGSPQGMAYSLILALSVLGLAGTSVSAQEGRGAVTEGNRLYQEGRYGEAHARYLEALKEAPESQLIRFNEGNALYQSDEFQRAFEAYQQAISTEDGELAADAWYNLGNALAQQQQLGDAVAAYKEALRRNPSNVDAKHNLELVLRQQEQEQEQDSENDEESEDGEQGEDSQDGESSEGDQEPQDGQGSPEDQEEEGESPPDDPADEDGDPQDRDSEDPEDQDQDSDDDPGDGNREQEDESPPEEGEPQPSDAGMSKEDAERLLQAIEDDPGDMNRPTTPGRRGRRPKKDW